MTLISDAAAALNSLQAEPGLPTRGVVALCDFGGTGTSITLADAADGYRPIGATVRHTDFSGELIDRALLSHVIADLSITGTADVAGTAAIGSLHRLRAAMPRRQGTSVARCGHDAVRRRSRVSRRGTADPRRARRRDPPAAGGVHRGTAGTPVPQPNSSRRPGGGRFRRGRRQHPCGHHRAVRAAPGARDHHRRTRTDRRRTAPQCGRFAGRRTTA